MSEVSPWKTKSIVKKCGLDSQGNDLTLLTVDLRENDIPYDVG